MSSKIAVIGSSNIDLIMQVPRFPVAGETVTGGVFTQTYGGKGANQAVAAARSGGEVGFVSCLGSDGFAEGMMDRFEQDHIDTMNVFQESGVATGTAMILVDKNGENCITVAPGANFRLGKRHIQKAQNMLKGCGLILLQGEILPEMLRYIIKWAADENKPVVLNLAPAQPLEREYLEKVAYLIVNETEAGTLVHRPVTSVAEAQVAAEELSTWISGGVIVSLGDKGCYVVKGSIRELVPAFHVKTVDTTAAGDVYCGTLATALVEGQPLLEAIRFASAAAAISCTRLGAQISIPTREEIEELLQDPAKYQ